jgi:hypothetical protein
MESQNHKSVLIAVSLLWSLVGCASVGVRNPAQAATNPRLPKQILVADFDASNGLSHVNRSGDELTTFQQKTTNALAGYLVADLNKSVLPAMRRNDSNRARADAWLVTGQFVRVDQGTRALRGLIGFGAGGTKLETIVRVYDLSHSSKQPVLQFETSGGSNAEPGAIGDGMFGALPNTLRNAGARGVTDDTARTARQITAMIAAYYSKNGGHLPGSEIKPKILAQVAVQ